MKVSEIRNTATGEINHAHKRPLTRNMGYSVVAHTRARDDDHRLGHVRPARGQSRILAATLRPPHRPPPLPHPPQGVHEPRSWPPRRRDWQQAQVARRAKGSKRGEGAWRLKVRGSHNHATGRGLRTTNERGRPLLCASPACIGRSTGTGWNSAMLPTASKWLQIQQHKTYCESNSRERCERDIASASCSQFHIPSRRQSGRNRRLQRLAFRKRSRGRMIGQRRLW